jgi:hypothetical protein
MKCPWVDAAMMRGRQSSVSPEHPFRARRVFVETTLFVGFADGGVINIVVRACRRDHGCVSSNP